MDPYLNTKHDLLPFNNMIFFCIDNSMILINYEETFTPVTKITIAQTLLLVGASYKWLLFQMDVKKAFLRGDIKEEIFM